MKAFARLACLVGVVFAVGIAASGVAAAPPAGVDTSQGLFVIGDGNAVVGASVTYWGAQWWKLNSVSGGGAPPSFKGFASDVVLDQHCGSFSTRPGNSPPPPDGPAPATIVVLVTSSVQKSGDTITGTVTNLALVRTDSGYDGNPGHAGTGTVVALLGCGDEL